ncbi:hypothetical protein N7457_006765 [Penicillium paradoxum]|uniref:uncharacterized protein n=1 Tax=Penicillium paradoxum TaxID=176176 RepID=UPI002548D9B6|nr:uncharacterized protein N7457_006765 [Penicillium paradoxum]KAJ5779045.1 hypothetical protein N7457_006765 [Penicillium paradoxum]
MRWVSALIALASASALQANALDTTIFTFSPNSASSTNANSQQQTITEDEARLVLELRMKSPVESVLGMVDADTVDYLNHFAQDDIMLFGVSSKEFPPKRSMLVLEGVDQQHVLAMQKAQPIHLRIPQVSSSFIGFDPLETLIGTAHTAKEDRGQHCTYFDGANSATSMISQTAKECLSRDPMFADDSGLLSHDFFSLVDSVESWTSKDRKDSALRLSFKNSFSGSPLGAEFLEVLLLHLARISSITEREITLLLLPQGIKSEGSTSRHVRRLSAPATQYTAFKRSAQDSLLQSTLTPICHASNSSCAEATNNCSGHGSCYLKYGAGVDGTTGNCYTCQCRKSIVQNSDGTTKTVQWGGSACQKRDISSPFFLIAGVSVLAIVMVGSAIGMLFSMGAQDLPSVISAGVGGPKSPM